MFDPHIAQFLNEKNYSHLYFRLLLILMSMCITFASNEMLYTLTIRIFLLYTKIALSNFFVIKFSRKKFYKRDERYC